VIVAALGLVLLIGTLIQSASAQTGLPKFLSAPFRHEALRETSGISTAIVVANYPNCRFSVGGTISGYAVSTLNIGWYMDWSTNVNPVRPNGAEYIQLVDLKPGPGVGYIYTPPISTIYSIVDQNPGAVWLIGNEPDSPLSTQDHLLPETYARAYHDLYTLIKQRDPSARIGAGSIVQPTPLRLQYLDRVLSTYQQLYGESLPADLWSVHSYILREIDPSDPEAMPNGLYEVWGAYIPPGITATRGELYTYSQMFDVAIFRQRLIDFRAWLRDRGYRDVPLYITEYGTLFPYPPYINDDPYVDELGVPMDEARTAAFMTSTFNVLLNLSDAAIGYPADANRLVQRWLWYSVSDPTYGGLLFDPNSHARRPLGDAYANYTQAITPSVDLLAVRVVAEPAAIWYEGVPVTATLKAQISNVGNISITQPITIGFYAGQPPSGTLLESKVITSSLAGCAATREVSVTWPNLSAGTHPVYVQIDPDNAIGEANESNNIVGGFTLVATHQVYLPLISRMSW
jgi:hypothetical protein